MSFINLQQAIDLIAKKTKDKCNEFSLLHCINNSEQKIDIFIDNSRHKFHIAYVSPYRTAHKALGDEWIVHHIEIDYEGKFRLNINELNELLLSKKLEVVKKENRDTEYALLAKRVNSDSSEDIKSIVGTGFNGGWLEAQQVAEELGFGQDITKFDILFDSEQIEKIASNSFKPPNKFTENNNERADKAEVALAVIAAIEETHVSLSKTDIIKCAQSALKAINIHYEFKPLYDLSYKKAKK